jgi:ribonuclease BN (tRNA processing enzyme)
MAGPGAGLEQPQLHLPPGGREALAEIGVRLGGFPDMFDRTFAISEYTNLEQTRIAGFDVLPVNMPHYGMGSFGFRVSDGTTVLAYSGDAGPGDTLVELARDSDLFVCEATLDGGEGEPRGHLTLDEAEAAFRSSGSRRLLVTHRPDERSADHGVELARDGLVLDL